MSRICEYTVLTLRLVDITCRYNIWALFLLDSNFKTSYYTAVLRSNSVNTGVIQSDIVEADISLTTLIPIPAKVSIGNTCAV